VVRFTLPVRAAPNVRQDVVEHLSFAPNVRQA
jgi:hypothetical protein